jgi:Tfp pilus assembly protein PilV
MLIIKNKNSYGFALVEIMICCAILSTITIALLSYAQKGLELSNLSLRQTQAIYLLEEGAEAIKTFRDDNWTNISSLTLDTNYYFTYDTSSGVWSLSQTPSMINGMFTRTVVTSSVNRDSNDDIVTSGGSVDTGSKLVTINVSWQDVNGESNSKALSFYIFNLFD